MNCYNQTVIYLITKDRRTKKCIVTIVEKKLMTIINDNAVECPYCGGDTKNTHNNDYGTPYVSDNGGIGWGLLGCCIPLAGLILFLVWKDTKPKTAKAAGIGALVSVGISILFYIIMIVAGVGAGIYGASSSVTGF